ncbi:hypothetical protein KDA_49740 [Dictyobacter alpinus]|uniref:Glycosyl hydrolase family 32 C-terminal domain-containing protein n=2 Tax=Dictyobacter alpinus TaxID=2014873 RepID=A0A402BDW5_9CHLR|nr:hypothetical protein KDA_49740 [Dictyobacter alpinus]
MHGQCLARSAIEVFAGNGEVIITDLIFPSPSPDSQEVLLYTVDHVVEIQQLEVFAFSSIRE